MNQPSSPSMGRGSGMLPVLSGGNVYQRTQSPRSPRQNRRPEPKLREEVPEQLGYVLNMISLTENPHIVGSAKYQSHKYPGDIDVFEKVVSKSGREEALVEFSSLLSNVGKLISIEPTVELTDFKCGHDMRFKHSPQHSHEDFLRHLRSKNLITKEELECKLNHLDRGEIDHVEKFLHELSTVRWSLPELIMGCKKLRGNVELKLWEALSMNSITKLDAATWFNSRIQSVEIFYMFSYTENGKVQSLYTMEDYARSIAADILKYKSTNPLKTMKRLWSLSRYTKCQNLVNALEPVFSSDVAALNQIRADIEVIKLLHMKHHLILPKLLIECLEFKKRLYDHLEPEEYQQFEGWIEHMYILWGNLHMSKHVKYENFDCKSFHKILDKIDQTLQPLIDKRAWEFYEKIMEGTPLCNNIQQLLEE